MSDDNRKPIWPWIVVALILLPVVYVAMFGPATFLMVALDSPGWVESWYYAFDPLDWLICSLPHSQGFRLNVWYHDLYLGWWSRLAESWRGGENAPLVP